MFWSNYSLLQEMTNGRWWKRLLIDTVLAITAVIVVTVFVFALQLHARVTTILLVDLFIVLLLTLKRGLRTAILAAVAACLAFDFFLVQPVFSLTVTHIEDAVELLTFLLFAIILSYAYSQQQKRVEKARQQKYEESVLYEAMLRKQHEEVSRRDREMSVLYDVMQVTRDQKDLKSQLSLIARTIEDTFAFCGIRGCAFLLPDLDGNCSLSMLSTQSTSLPKPSSNEEASLMWVMEHGKSVTLPEIPLISRPKGSYLRRVVVSNTQAGHCVYHCNHLIPLLSRSGQKVLGVLQLFIEDDANPELVAIKKHLEKEDKPTDNLHPELFARLLDHAVCLIEQTLIERALMQQEALHEELRRRTEELQTAIISSVSHDFHTPLTLIKGAASSLLGQEISSDAEPAYRRTLEDIVSEANWLERIVMRMLDLSRIENGALKLEKELYPIDEIILYTLDLGHMRSLLEGRRIEIHVPDDLPPVEADPIFIGQVLVNLIENAIRYTPVESPIDITVQSNGEELLVSVADRGPGIPLSNIDHIFERFYRVKQQLHENESKVPVRFRSAPREQGSGLGLAVCQGFVKAHGGHIWVQNRDGGGATFQFTLPLAKAEGASYEKNSRG